MNRGLLVDFIYLFSEPTLPIKEYLAGISRLRRLQYVSHLLGYLSQIPAPKRNHITDMQQFFGAHNHLFADEVYTRVKVLQNRGHDRLNFLHPKTVLQLYCYCFELPDEPDTKSAAELEKSLFKACLLLNGAYIAEQDQASAAAKALLPTQPLAAMVLALTFSDFELVNLRLLNIAILQLIKSVRLFEFLEKEARFAPLLQAFLQRFDCKDWPEYFRKLSGITKPVMQAENPGRISVEIPDSQPDCEGGRNFLRYFALREGQPLDKADFTSLRATPLVEETPGTFVLAYPVLVLETMHKGLYFQFNLANRSLPKGQREPDWRSVYCDLFSEQYLLYLLLNTIFQGRGLALSGRAIFEGWQLKGQSEPDYYFRHDHRAVLFESKDVLVHKDAKAGHDFATYLEEVKKKFYEDENHHPKAAKQLANNVARLLRHELLFDNDFAPAELIVYPVLVVHDRLYNQPGLNLVVNDWFQEELASLKQEGLPVHNVHPLIIIDADTLLAYHEDFRDGRMVFEDVLEEYVAYMRAPAWAGISAVEDEQRLLQSIHPFALFLENYAERRGMLGIPKDMLYQILPIVNRGAAE
ncbi:hypothetical protein MTX78_25010 (plasmid) [Hymenobacter tibetensis]|uniref:Uncharacterized protein n=1 Tax=Hymenobacter tibetensis TaxID=497967 RepID=A0ABY4D5U1_9BACT|nr:hypothetical protein [Hymenobacter tibetensis]UOG77626.1 hypothetical protein MTX78_25010 [Hymenobacter tibetensis]